MQLHLFQVQQWQLMATNMSNPNNKSPQTLFPRVGTIQVTQHNQKGHAYGTI